MKLKFAPKDKYNYKFGVMSFSPDAQPDTRQGSFNRRPEVCLIKQLPVYCLRFFESVIQFKGFF